MGWLRELCEDLIDPSFFQHRHQMVRMTERLHLRLLGCRFRLGFLHGVGVQVLSDGQIGGVSISGFSASVGEAIIGGMRACHVWFLLKFLVVAVGCPLALHDLPGDVVQRGFEGQFLQVVLSLLLSPQLHLPMVLIESLETFCASLDGAVGDFLIDLFADGVDFGLEGAFSHQLLLFLLDFLKQGLAFFLGPLISVL